MSEPHFAPTPSAALHKMVLALECQGGVCEEMFFALVEMVACLMGHEANAILGKHVRRSDNFLTNDGAVHRKPVNHLYHLANAEAVLTEMIAVSTVPVGTTGS